MSSAGAISGTGLPNTAGVECFVDIYTFEDQSLSFTGQQLLSVQTTKSIKEDVGRFQIVIPPITLKGNLSWSQIITPMSLAVIGMKRGNNKFITMVGLITSPIRETQTWNQNGQVTRAIILAGVDAAYYFTMLDYYTLWYLQNTGQFSVAGGQAAGLLSGPPDQVGSNWYSQIMKSMFANTKLPYKGSGVLLVNALATFFEPFDVFVPYGDYFLGTNGPWFDKFRTIFPFPFYEFFVTTSFNNAFPQAGGGTSFSTFGLGSDVSSTIALIARLNPVPFLEASLDSGNVPVFNSINTDKWEALTVYTLDNLKGFLESNVYFSEEEVTNFFILNPLWMMGQNGDSNSNIRQAIFNYGAVFDQASIDRYGYRPMSHPISWFTDITGAIAQDQNKDPNATQKLMANMLAKLCGYYEASTFMLKGTVSTWLRPDIEIGTRFQYPPFRDGRTWEFYIASVTHEYNFGGPSRTTIGLERGLPRDVYTDTSSNGLLFNIHIGNAQRIGGDYQIGLPPGSAASLKALSPEAFQSLMAKIDKLYVTPQGIGQTP